MRKVDTRWYGNRFEHMPLLQFVRPRKMANSIRKWGASFVRVPHLYHTKFENMVSTLDAGLCGRSQNVTKLLRPSPPLTATGPAPGRVIPRGVGVERTCALCLCFVRTFLVPQGCRDNCFSCSGLLQHIETVDSIPIDSFFEPRELMRLRQHWTAS